MNDAPTQHPPAERLAAFHAGLLSAEEAVAVSRHLLDCEQCRNVASSPEAETVPPRPASAVPTVKPPAPGQPDTQAHAPSETSAIPRPHVMGVLADHPRYRVLQLLGVGGMGCVFKAEHRVMERVVALKVLNHELIVDASALKRFRQEVKAAARLSHPNIVTAHDADEAGGVHFLIMEYVEGQSLAEHIVKHGAMPIARACECVRQAAAGLQHAYEKGMVHRDIKPQNLMLGPQGRVKILDFGLARLARHGDLARAAGDTGLGVQGAGLTQLGTLLGTPDYMAPEQADDAHKVDIRADIYSLGCTLFHLVTGEPPFPKGGPIEKVLAHLEQTPRLLTDVRADVPRELAAVVSRMLVKDPAQRYQTPADVAKALAPFVKPSVAGKPASRVGIKPISRVIEAPPQAAPAPPPAPPTPPSPITKTIRRREVDRKENPFGTEKPPERSQTPWLRHKPVWLAVLAVIVMAALGITMLTQEPPKSTRPRTSEPRLPRGADDKAVQPSR